MSSFSLSIVNNAGILKDNLVPTNFNYQNGAPGTAGPGLGNSNDLGTGNPNVVSVRGLLVTGFSNFFTDNNGNFLTNNPPPGFNFTTGLFAQLHVKFYLLPSGGFITLQNISIGSSSVNGPATGSANFLDTITLALPSNRSYFLLTTDLYNISAFSVTSPIWFPISPGGGGFPETDFGFTVFGNYQIISSQWRLTNLTVPNTHSPLMVARPGDRIKLDTPNNSYDFTTITKVKLNNIQITNFEIQTPFEMEFIIPLGLSPGDYIAAVEGTQFSGDAILAGLTVLIADGSGIYKVQSGKSNDTIYLSPNAPAATSNVKIPDPFGRIGFIGG